jgi:hypothetical protein
MSELFKDKFGLLVHADMDPGDALADTARYLYGTWLNGRLDIEMLNALITHCIPLKGILRRHPIRWDDTSDLSRDQQTPTVILLEAAGFTKTLEEIRRRHKERGWRYQNLDFATWEHINYYTPQRRDRRGDILLLLNSIIRVIHSHLDHDECGIDQNHMIALIQCAVSGHTSISDLARRIYCKRFNGPLYALKRYYRVDNPGIAKELEGPVRKYILNEHIDLPYDVESKSI